MEKALVTGASGFIGSHLVKALEKRKIEVVKLPYKKLLVYDIPTIDFDYIFHLAAYGNHYQQQDIYQMIESNIEAVCYLLESTRYTPYKAFVNFSTSSVTLPVQTFYSATKLAGETICQVFGREYKKPVISVRPYSVYGPGEADFRFIPTVIKKGLKGKVLNLVREPSHDWIYVDDLIDGVMFGVKYIDILKDNISFLDIGTGVSWNNEEVVEIIEKVIGKKIKRKILKRPLREYDTKEWRCDKAASIFAMGWRPEYTLVQGIRKVVKYEKQRLKTTNN